MVLSARKKILSWDNFCNLKSLGGLGIPSMKAMNDSLLARLGSKMVSNQPLLWVDSLRGIFSSMIGCSLLHQKCSMSSLALSISTLRLGETRLFPPCGLLQLLVESKATLMFS